MLHTSRTRFLSLALSLSLSLSLYIIYKTAILIRHTFCRPRKLRRHYNFNDFIVIKFQITCTIKSDLDFCYSSAKGSFVVYYSLIKKLFALY